MTANGAYGKSDPPFGQTPPGFTGLRAVFGSDPPFPPERSRVGVDVVDVKRIRRLLDRHGDAFLARFFTAHERRACRRAARPARRLAVCWGMREAGYKAVGGGRLWTDYRADFPGGTPRMAPAASLYDRPDVNVSPPARWWTRTERSEGRVLVAAVAIWATPRQDAGTGRTVAGPRNVRRSSEGGR